MKKIFILSFLFFVPILTLALTKPGPDSDVESLSYVFYLYYDNGKIFFDRDYEVKFDVLSEKYADGSTGSYKIELFNLKSELVKTIQYDPRQLLPGPASGKIQVKAPYVSDGAWVRFYDSEGTNVGSIHVGLASLCNDDGICDSLGGENEKSCPNDCKESRPRPTPEPVPVYDPGTDYVTLGLYGVGGIVVALGAWYSWRWWRKKRGDSFLPPAPPSQPSGDFQLPPTPPQG